MRYRKSSVFIVILLIINSSYCTAQNTTNIDVQHYRYELIISDHNDILVGTAVINIKFLQPSVIFSLDLDKTDSTGKGMQVLNVSEDGNKLSFMQTNNKLQIQLKEKVNAGEVRTVNIKYKGIPANGLIIGRSIYNKRTFFGDNWPNRAHYWLPCNDIPSDKASLEFIITAPKHYSIVSNGIKTEEYLVTDSTKLTHWKEDVPLPTKVMVFGAADFAVSNADYAGNIPVTSWVYEEAKENGFYDYSLAKDILQYYINYIGPYGYKKLANVQSKTMFGGMENAGTIFYFEKSITGTGKLEDLIAHEIVHQWFGNMVTETNFKHLWLSEGFATYLTDVYIEAKYGTDSLNSRLTLERNKVINFAARSAVPVIDTTSNYMKLLNANSYQKGGWILHMLRNNVGESVFKKIIQEQYKKFAGKNVSSEDFIATAERVSQKKLKTFFNQWLYKVGLPVLATTWKYNQEKKNIVITFEQKQAGLFTFPLDFLIKTEKGNLIKTSNFNKRKKSITVKVNAPVTQIIIDPNCKLLWQVYNP